jgi:hypothetical protein
MSTGFRMFLNILSLIFQKMNGTKEVLVILRKMDMANIITKIVINQGIFNLLIFFQKE